MRIGAKLVVQVSWFYAKAQSNKGRQWREGTLIELMVMINYDLFSDQLPS
jgi:hypothetical protein